MSVLLIMIVRGKLWSLHLAHFLTRLQQSFWPKSRVLFLFLYTISFFYILSCLNIIIFSLIDTGELFRCDVIVNHIHKIQIAMKTRELFIEDAPEEFYARALDDQGACFSFISFLELILLIEFPLQL